MPRWWLRRGESTFGPIEPSTIVEALRDGRIEPGDLACKEGGREWLLVTAVPEVADAFAPKRSAPPPEQDPQREPAWMIGDFDGEIVDGPVSLEQVRRDVASGKLTGGELLARAGSTAWRPLQEILAEAAQVAAAAWAPPVPQATTRIGTPLPVARPSQAPKPPSRPPQPPPGPPLPSRFARTQVATAPSVSAASSSAGSAGSAPRANMPSAPPRPSARPSAPPRPSARPPPQPLPEAPLVDGIPWWVARAGDGPLGPLTTEQMREGLANGQLDPIRMVCRGDQGEWRAAGTFDELRSRQGTPPLPRR
ncbi:MAG: hypothetical protein NVS3B10_07670 [Polyangiales bacterium]